MTELATFRRFAGVCPVIIQSESISKRQPPEPDIACTLRQTGEEVAFELVQIVDEGLARSSSHQTLDMESFRNAYRGDAELQAALDERFGDACISIAFVPGLASRHRRSSIQMVLRELATMDSAYVGEWRPPHGSPLCDIVWYILIRRGQFQGPDFYVPADTSIGDPTVARVKTKWHKVYRTQRPIELLAYYCVQPVGPEAWWLSSLRDFLGANWATGPFRRIWVFDSWEQTILYHEERPENARSTLGTA